MDDRTLQLSAPSRDVVVMSGGLDSTLIAARLVTDLARKAPVVGLVIGSHPQMESLQTTQQVEALRRFERWANKGGFQRLGDLPERLTLTLIHTTVKGVEAITAPAGQTLLWLSTVVPYLRSGDRVHFGYIRGDDFWHTRGKFEAAFHALCALAEVTATLHFDLEWYSKADVVHELMRLRVPTECTWTCEEPVKARTVVRPCGRCPKCRALADAIAPPMPTEPPKLRWTLPRLGTNPRLARASLSRLAQTVDSLARKARR